MLPVDNLAGTVISTGNTSYTKRGIMDQDQARNLALGYAWAYEDATGRPTAGGNATAISSATFAMAFTAGWSDYNAAKRGSMTSVQSAYFSWQASGGRTIFHSALTELELQALQHAPGTAQASPAADDYRASIDRMGGYSDMQPSQSANPPHRDLGTGFTYLH